MKAIRSTTAVVLALTAGLALGACTPPHQKDADKRVDTATTGPQSPAVDDKMPSAVVTETATVTPGAETEGSDAAATSTVIATKTAVATSTVVVAP